MARLETQQEVLPGETIIARYADVITLTNFRVWQEYGRTARTMMLEDVSMCSVHYRDRPGVMLCAVFIGLASMLCFAVASAGQARSRDSFRALGTLCLFGAAFLAFTYFATRESKLQITASCGEAISVAIALSTPAAAKEFTRKLQQAKNHRFLARLPVFIPHPAASGS